MTTLHIPPPAVPVEVTAEQVVAYLLRPGSGWVEWSTVNTTRAFRIEAIDPVMVLVSREPHAETIADIARAEGRHPLAVAEEIAGPVRGASVGARCRGAGTIEDYDSGRVKCMVRGMAERWRAANGADRADAAHGAGESEEQKR